MLRKNDARARGQQNPETGLAKGGDRGGRKPKAGVRKTPANAPVTLAEVGIDKNLAKEGRKLGALSDREFGKSCVHVTAPADTPPAAHPRRTP